ncbi:Y-family DNA polymerase [Glaciecola sp. 1036]|uniref:Y-family DNA polymerase n=1 Tax=Alteromonadaceae TaxID=72275 RepID=UPI003CFC852B
MQFDTQSLWLYLHFPMLQLNVLEQSQVSETQDIDKPRAIYQSTNNQIVQVNQAAFNQGIRIGMGLAKASLLFSDLALHEYMPEIEENTIQQLAQSLYLITSDIALSPPSGIILRAQNMLHLYGDLKSYWRIISYCLGQHGYDYQAASAYSIQSAKLLALQGKTLITEERKAIQQQLEKCTISLSEIDAKDVEKLARIGVHTVKELQKLPAAELANRVSRYSMNVINELRGHSPAKVRFFQPATEFQDFIELIYEIEDLQKLLPVLARSLSKLEHFLYVRNARCMSIALDLLQREESPLKLEFNSALPIYRSSDWLEIIGLKLERTALSAPVYGVELYCVNYEITPVPNDDMFAQKSYHIEGLSLISRLISKLGEDKVKSLSYHADFRPEKCSQLSPVGHKRNKQPSTAYADRPGILLPQPQLLTHQISIIKGPERIISGWWDEQQIQRDYFVGQDAQGQQVWVYKTPDNQWFLHGYFV